MVHYERLRHSAVAPPDPGWGVQAGGTCSHAARLLHAARGRHPHREAAVPLGVERRRAFEDAASCRPVELGDVTLQFSRSSGPGGQSEQAQHQGRAAARPRPQPRVDPAQGARAAAAHPPQRINTRDVLGVLGVRSSARSTPTRQGRPARVQALLDDACAAAAPPKEPSPEKRRRIRALQTAENRKRIEERKRLSQKKRATSRCVDGGRKTARAKRGGGFAGNPWSQAAGLLRPALTSAT